MGDQLINKIDSREIDVYGFAIFHDLSDLHQGLKNSELQRGVNVDYGTGVCPVSQRIVLKVTSRHTLNEN